MGFQILNQFNTASIGNILTENKIDFILEAHCYLKVNQKRVDFTTSQSEFEKIQIDIVSEKEIEPEQVAEFKVVYHRNYLKKWIIKNKIDFDYDRIWQIREKCIEKLCE